ncbi:phosphatidylinositol N-acetylglucosaminyltransferase subunit C [Leucosporidium creatinivorum]|uniref:Phosphatidylinositol N-acetylglucosaminyltransferase subunit C n=1 Tax=Leucosporidium creatinivorum TaxID=106004 RepID=A0A1Y2FZC3_9BASI|nr:phosphatidylinositol N-acetylglucosaminyltransferase subunit C [Leucosporidium creatinivorum]
MPLFQSPSREPYRKVLYLRQEAYPDNYVDSSFLSDLQRNVNVHPASLPVLLAQTLPITQHLASTFIFISIFIRLSRGALDPPRLLAFSAVVAIICRVWSNWISAPTTNGGAGGGSTGSSVVAPLIPLFTLYLLSPALKTLTKATTSDSIWALSGTLFCINLFLGDYRSIPSSYPRPLPSPAHTTISPNSSSPSLSTEPSTATPLPPAPPPPRSKSTSTLPLTAALSASTVLASRLSSNLSVFSLLLFSTLWFGPFPLLRSDLPIKPTILLTVLLVAGALWSLVGIGGGAVKIALAMLLGISVAAPMGRGWLMIRYKDRVRGPWDQAVPRVGGGGT